MVFFILCLITLGVTHKFQINRPLLFIELSKHEKLKCYSWIIGYCPILFCKASEKLYWLFMFSDFPGLPSIQNYRQSLSPLLASPENYQNAKETEPGGGRYLEDFKFKGASAPLPAISSSICRLWSVQVHADSLCILWVFSGCKMNIYFKHTKEYSQLGLSFLLYIL